MPRRPRSPVARVLADLARALGRHRIDWYLFGAQAAALRGLRRATVDVDVTVFAADADGATIAGWVDRDFALRVPDVDAFAQRTRVLPLVHKKTSIDVDLVLGSAGLESYFLDRAERIDIDGVSVLVPLADDLIIMKLISRRALDLDDVVAIASADPQAVDLGRVREVLQEIEVGVGEAGFLAALDEVVRRLRSNAL